jgi:hypothetical protein
MRRALVRTFVVLAAAVLMVALAAPSAFAGTPVVQAGYSNSIAYNLKSLQTTRFWGSVLYPNMWAVLKVGTPYGDRYLYKGPIQAAGTRFDFPVWDGRGPHGERLPSSGGYRWTLTVNKGGNSWTTSGVIAVSRIIVTTSVTTTEEFLQLRNMETFQDAYMLAGSYRCYLTAISTAAPTEDPGCFGLMIWYPAGPTAALNHEWQFPAGTTVRANGSGTIARTGIHNFSLSTNHPSRIILTFLQ